MTHTAKCTKEEIIQDGNFVGYFSGTRQEVWVSLKDPRTGKYVSVARFKYFRPKTKANKMFRNVLRRFTVEEVIDGMKETSPVEFCRDNNVDYLVRP